MQALESLAQTFRQVGILEPLLVRRISEPHKECYEIIAGECRWRAAQLVGFCQHHSKVTKVQLTVIIKNKKSL